MRIQATCPRDGMIDVLPRDAAVIMKSDSTEVVVRCPTCMTDFAVPVTYEKAVELEAARVPVFRTAGNTFTYSNSGNLPTPPRSDQSEVWTEPEEPKAPRITDDECIDFHLQLTDEAIEEWLS